MPNLPVRLAIAGCGFCAREIHIPRLLKLPGQFQIAGVSDVIPEAAVQAGRLAGCQSFSSVSEMLEQTRSDALAILTPLHAGLIELALQQGLDIFVEKPLCETPADAVRLVDLAQRSGCVLVVGAMRLFNPAIQTTRQIVDEIGPLRWVEVRDYCGAGTATAGGDLVASALQSGLPVADGREKNFLQALLLEFIHDLSILRAVFGGPLQVRHAWAVADGWSATGELVLPGGVPCMFAFSEFGLTAAPVFDVSLRLFGERGCAEIGFGDPNAPGGCTTTIRRNFLPAETIVCDEFTAEWLAFEQAVRTRQPVHNTGADGAADLDLAWQIFDRGRRAA